MAEIPFVAGPLCYLRGMTPDDMPNMVRWFSDPENTRYTETGRVPVSQEFMIQRYLTNDSTRASFAICDTATQQHIGSVSLVQIHPVHRRGGIGIMIGERSFQGQGYGTAAMRLILEYGFRRLNMHSIWLDVVAANVGGMKAYQKVGFQIDCVEREAVWADGQFHDMLQMSILAREYFASLDHNHS